MKQMLPDIKQIMLVNMNVKCTAVNLLLAW